LHSELVRFDTRLELAFDLLANIEKTLDAATPNYFAFSKCGLVAEKG
jgi:hypothetical protein